MSSITSNVELRFSSSSLAAFSVRSKLEEANRIPGSRLSPRSSMEFPDEKRVLFSMSEQMHTESNDTEAITEETVSIVEDDIDYEDDNNIYGYDGDHVGANEEDDEDNSSTRSPISATDPDALTRESFRKERRRKIQWSGQVRVQEIRHLNNIPEFEKEAVWMSQVDYKLIKSIAKTTVYMMMKGQRIGDDDPDYCTRGLEFRTRSGSKIRNQNKLRARSAVLNEQDLQREEGFFDPQFIAMASMDESFECREAARKRAEGDVQSIRSYMADVRRGVRGLPF